MISLNTLISNLDLLLSQNIEDDAVRCSIIAKRLHRYLRPDYASGDKAVVLGRDHVRTIRAFYGDSFYR